MPIHSPFLTPLGSFTNPKGGLAIVRNGLKLYHKYTTDAQDTSGEGNHGTLSGGASVDEYLSMNGGSLTIDDNSSLNISNGTIEAWVRTTDKDFKLLEGQDASHTLADFSGIRLTHSNVGDITLQRDLELKTTPQDDGIWYMYTITGVDINDWTTFKLCDGAEDTDVDSLRFYDRELSEAERLRNYTYGRKRHPLPDTLNLKTANHIDFKTADSDNFLTVYDDAEFLLTTNDSKVYTSDNLRFVVQ